jgi:nucleoside-diphosphate-sugar epimerase
MRVLVTGATGFVAGGLLARLERDADWEIRAAVRAPRAPLPAGVEEVVVGDLQARADLGPALRGVTHVVHLAARVHVMRDVASDPLTECRAMNVGATMHLARAAAAAGVRRFVFLSSIKAQGERGTYREDTPPHPMDPYGVSKLEAERALRELAAATGMEVAIVRSPLVYGPGVGANFAALLRAVDRGLPLPFALVRNQRSLVARGNLADFMAKLLRHGSAANETFGVSDGEDLSMPELIRRIARALDRPARLLPVPVALLRGGATLLGRGDVAQRLLDSLRIDITKARTVLGWRPPLTVDAALRETVVAWRAGQGR